MNIGELVKLKSGGPVMCIMNVSNKSEPSQYQCGWFNSRNEFTREWFSSGSVQKHAPKRKTH